MKYYVPILDNGSGQVRAEFVVSFFAAFSAKIGRELHLTHKSDSHPGRCRNRAAASFLASDCTHLFFIDGDIVFNAGHLEMMDESDAPILAGMYFLKNPDDLKPCLQTLPDFQRCATGSIFPVARAGTGFLRIAREVFEAMKPMVPSYTNHGRLEWDFFQSGVVTGEDGVGEWLSEDWFFCDLARKAGFQVMLHSGIQLGHMGSAQYPIVKKQKRLRMIPADFDDYVDEIFEGEYEIPGIEPRTILDIGANIGSFTAWAKEKWPAAKVTAFEPHPDNAALWRWNTREFRDVELVESAVTVQSGPVVLHEGKNCGEHSTRGVGKPVMVGSVNPGTLRSADFIKIDTEGCEVEIVRNLDLTNTKGIALEYHNPDDRTEIETFLAPSFDLVSVKRHDDNRGVLRFRRKEAHASAA